MMRRCASGVALVLVVLFLPIAGAGPSQAANLPSKSTWLKDVSKVMAPSQDYLTQRVAQRRSGERLAIVLDIDNTSIATEYAWPRPVKKTLAFAQLAVRKKVTVFFATGRRSNDLGNIRKVLTKAGYRYADICGRKSGESLSQSKQRCRRAFKARGFTIVANVGNRETDFTGGNYERRFKLPSYGRQLS